MFPAFLITFREVLEATLIVATILGVLAKLHDRRGIRTVWLASGCATIVSILFLGLASIFGFKVQELYTGRVEETIEGMLMLVSALFITSAVFFLHKYFSRYKIHLIQKINDQVKRKEQQGLFVLVFTAVFREGFEIVLFLTTVYFSSEPISILRGFLGGLAGGILISLALFTATFRMPIYLAFRTSSALLILFAAGLLARAVHEFAEAGFFPELWNITLHLIPSKGTYVADLVKALFGLTHQMDILQIMTYVSYAVFMGWWVFIRPRVMKTARDQD